VRFPSAERYEAVSIGTARLSCRDGDVVLEVRAPVRIAIDPVPTARSGARLYYGAKIYDSVARELSVGDAAVVSWTFSGALTLRPYPGCGDVIPLCPSVNGGFATATSLGVGVIDVRYAGIGAHSTTRVTLR